MTKPSPSDLTGLILAGGRSRRFGADKARHAVEGRTMIARVADAVGAVAGTLLISVGEEETAFDLPARPVRYVVDQHKDAGPLAGLHAGLLAARTPWVLAVACDLPFLTTDALRILLAARTPEADAVAARTPDGRVHPLCACYHRRALPRVEAHLAAGTFALHALLDHLQTVRFVDLPAGPLRNVNTPTDLPDSPFRNSSNEFL